MIFVTVGTQLPFQRLIDAVNAFAAADPSEEIVAQTCGDISSDRWPHLTLIQRLAPDQFAARMQAARLIVAHAGIGTILSAKQYKRPIILVPRRYELGEHRNDHQMATARQMEGRTGLRICWDVDQLPTLITTPTPAVNDINDAPQRAHLIKHIRGLVVGK